jgi:diguanylate cyclase (GGDEF)-like protein
MRLRGAFLQSRVARRVLGLFLLSAFVPTLLLAVLSQRQVTELLEQHSITLLNRSSESYGLGVYDRFLMADGALQTLDAVPAVSDRDSGRLRLILSHWFKAVTLFDARGGIAVLYGAPAEFGPAAIGHDAHLAAGESVLYMPRSTDERLRIYIARRLSGGTTALAELDLDHLWGDADDLPYSTDICVVGERAAPLYCTQPLLAALVEARPTAGEPARAWSAEYAVGQWQIFLDPRFHVPEWTVLTFQPRALALGSLSRFQRVSGAVLILGLLLVSLLSLVLIRRTLGPLETLLEGTRRIARDDFAGRVPAAGRDEFGELARSFNAMSARLGRQFGALRVLARIDRLILSKPEVDRVLETALEHLHEIVASDSASVALIGEGGALRLWQRGPQRRESGRARVTTLDTGAHALVQHATEIVSLRGEALAQSGLAGLLPGEISQAILLSVRRLDEPRALIALGWRAPTELAPETLDHLRELGDRVAVALGAAARDAQLLHQAQHDCLTDLPNRLLLEQRLGQEIAHAQRHARRFALLFIDLDRFKAVNDTLGHESGDQLLREAALRLRQRVRESDMLARFGGDEFVVLLSEIGAPGDAGNVAQDLIDALSRRFDLQRGPVFVGASIGIAIYPGDGNGATALLGSADAAMYRAKDEGRGRFVYFEQRMNAEALERMALERELREAIAGDGFEVHFQPKIDANSGALAGAEALVRWKHAVRGWVPPMSFIALAEETGLIGAIGHKVLLSACAAAAQWRALGLDFGRVAVNLSSRQFGLCDVCEEVRGVLHATGLPAEALELEVTESLFVGDQPSALRALEDLRALGVTIAVDDFGTGYSSLSYLRRLPLDVVKIDRAFVTEAADDADTRGIVRAIISMSHTLGKTVVAEGVETAAQLAILRAAGCDQIQGYYYSRPLPPDQFLAWARRLPVGCPVVAG